MKIFMLKKFLLFCMTMFCFSLRAEDKIIDTTNIVSADNIKQSQKNTLSYSFTVPQKDIIEDDMATSEELETFEKIALINEKRALELSMYYQGWGKKECFYALDDVKSTSPIRYSYVKNSELTRQIKMRDFDKAIKFAEIAFEKERIKNPKKLHVMKLSS